VYAPKLDVVYPGVFAGDVALQHIDLPTLRVVDQDTFSGATALKEVRLTREGVAKAIKANAFGGCAALTALHLGTVVPAVDDGAFTGTNPNLVVYYSGDDPGWASFQAKGNSTATLKHE
jgi:hypothetical protein